MQEIWLLTDPQWIRHSCSSWGGWVKRTKGLQRFSTPSFLAKARDVKNFSLLLLWSFFFFFRSGLGDASYRTDKSWTAGLLPFTWECMREEEKKTPTTFSSYLHHDSSTYRWQHRQHERDSLPFWEERQRGQWGAGVRKTPIWGRLSWWSVATVALGVDGVRGARGGMGVVWLLSKWPPQLSFQVGLSTLRVRYKDGMPLIPVMPTCLKPSHLLPKADTRPDHQSEPPKRSHCHRRASRSGTVHLASLPPRSRHAIYFPLLIAHYFICALNLSCISWLRSGEASTAPPDKKALSLLFSDIITV